jgi:DnaJ-class molecular chaperone
MDASPSGMLPDLEECCDRCLGEGGRWNEYSDYWHRCGQCNGAGHVPTEFGEKVLALMRHNFRPMLQDVQDDRNAV